MSTPNRRLPFTLARVLSAAAMTLASFGCSSGSEDPPAPEVPANVEQALGGTCPGVCNSTVPCNQSCTVDSAQGLQTITCGQYGSCRPSTTSSTTGSTTSSTTGSPPPNTSCPAGQRCIEYGLDSSGRPYCKRCGTINGQ